MAVTDYGRFYAEIPIFRSFAKLMDPALYRPLPDDWLIGTADIVESTKAIADRRYKAVNMAGAAAIAAVTNALEGQAFPFVFGGDGASFAIAPQHAEPARAALAATATWVQAELGLVMRVALIPVSCIRMQGLDVQVARFGVSPHVAYAMFAGGGLGWAEAAMKRGEFAVAPAPAGSHPDLSGLSCRFSEIPSARGLILSMLIVAAPGADQAVFRGVIEQIVTLVERSPDAGRPVPAEGPGLRWPSEGVDYEARARRGGPLLVRRVTVLTWTLWAYLVMRLGLRVGGFVPAVYMAQAVANSDFRKYDDGLRMVLDCSHDLADDLEQRLRTAAAAGTIRYGLHRQDAAMMTCFTPSAMRADHVHFIDGARGGYATAATLLKASLT